MNKIKFALPFEATVVMTARRRWFGPKTLIGFRWSKNGRRLWFIRHRDGRLQWATQDLAIRIMAMITNGTFPDEGY